MGHSDDQGYGRSFLDEREFAFLTMMADGRRRSAIAQALGVSVRTLGDLHRRLLAKLGARTEQHAVAIAFRRGLLDVDRRGSEPAQLPRPSGDNSPIEGRQLNSTAPECDKSAMKGPTSSSGTTLALLRREQGGQVIAVVTVGIVALIGLAAFTIDVGSWYQVSRQAQAAADAGATAAADDLPGNATQARSDATTYVNKNISGATTTTVTPYNGDTGQVQVTVTKSAPTFFAKIFGLSSVQVAKSAVAKHVAGGAKYAIFTKNTSCSSGITWSASGVTIAGGVHSNSSLGVTGGSNTFGPTSYKGPNNCSFSDSGGDNSYNGSATPTTDTTNEAWPEPWPTSAAEIPSYGITCTDNASSFTWTSTPGPQSGHTYCATSSISIKGSGYTCTCTFIAPTVSITGASETLRPNFSDLLIDAYGTSTWKLSGSNDNITGTVFVPNATFNVSGSANSLYNVFLEGNNSTMTGSGWTLTGTGPVTGGNAGSQLVQ